MTGSLRDTLGFLRRQSGGLGPLHRIEIIETHFAWIILTDAYDEFYQVGIPTKTSRDGYGLGLSIVQRLVKLLTLKLDVDSEAGGVRRFAKRSRLYRCVYS